MEILSAPSLGSCPIALNTWLSPTFPDEQAEPAESAIPSYIEGDLPGLGLQARKREKRGVGDPHDLLTVKITSGRVYRNPFFQPRPQRGKTRRLSLDSPSSNSGGSPKTDNRKGIFRSRAMALFLATTMDQRLRHHHFAARNESPAPFGPPSL